MDFNSWIGLAVGVMCAFFAHVAGRRSGQTALRRDLKIKLKQIQVEAERETDEIEKHSDEKVKAIDATASRIESADDASLVDEFNDAFTGE